MNYKGVLPGDRVWVIADPHFGHANIIRYCNRPFQSVGEMDRELMARWNAVVGGQDTVIVAGDFCMGRRAKYWKRYAARLHGELIMMDGNHDHNPGWWESMEITYMGEKFLIVHRPDAIPEGWPGWAIHGHVHNHNPVAYPLISWGNRRINVSVEMINYQPILLPRLMDLALSQERPPSPRRPSRSPPPLPTDAGEPDYIPPGGQ